MNLSQIVRFPIKSCRGISVRRARVVRGGIENDRRWMIVDHTGRFVTQREEPRLALIDVSIEGERIEVASAGHDRITVPLAAEGGDTERVTVWSNDVDALVHDDGSAWFSSFLGRDVRLVYMPEASLRQVSPARARPGDVVSFADGYPLLLASEASLADLGARIEANGGARVPMSRFRPNVVVTDAPAWDEDAWRTFTIGAVAFRAPKPCDRCVITTIDPATAKAEKEPLRTLATFRRWAIASGTMGVWFGVNLIADGVGELAVGDPVVVTTRET
jgi:uncharacterized protein YcbX